MIARARLLDFLFGALAGAGVLALLSPSHVVDAAPSQDPMTATSDDFVVATGTAAHGGALLFVLNTRTRVLNVYEAEGGSRATRGVTFVASRKIERDLYVTGYNDKSEYSYQDLVERFRVEESRSRDADDSAPAPAGNR